MADGADQIEGDEAVEEGPGNEASTAGQAAVDPTETLSWIGSINAKHMIKVKDAMKELLQHPQMAGIKTQQALSRDAGASISPFSLEDVRASLLTAGTLALGLCFQV